MLGKDIKRDDVWPPSEERDQVLMRLLNLDRSYYDRRTLTVNMNSGLDDETDTWAIWWMDENLNDLGPALHKSDVDYEGIIRPFVVTDQFELETVSGLLEEYCNTLKECISDPVLTQTERDGFVTSLLKVEAMSERIYLP